VQVPDIVKVSLQMVNNRSLIFRKNARSLVIKVSITGRLKTAGERQDRTWNIVKARVGPKKLLSEEKSSNRGEGEDESGTTAVRS